MVGAVCAKRAAIFDLDGTLIDSLPDLAAALNRSLARHGQAAVEAAAVKPMIGDGALMLLKRGYAVRGLVPSDEDVRVFLADYEAHVTDLTTVFAGIPAALATLAAQGLVLAVCTNKPEASARKVLAALDLEAPFQVVIGGDATPFRKPDPRHLQAVLDAIGVSAACAVMIGDHPNDLAAAAGCDAAGIFCSWGYGQSDAVHRVDTPAALPGLIGTILPG
ncbi:MAG TPA: HAD-IA family hydrolase [Acidiphilium sp.]|nr:MAG: phosphoglycolate phosphatase [Acidiphilium sp. 21-60-14]OYV90441.1 MAG: phosphoglycolate phosphatase [Acidiphilium sp. 37-60-79]OZB38845.1 MAG: phosphoglycolate phosphatase [Acidiphilium sp. 34-60-192]HQT87753.1 HAD-IA family hydrolase [Acidiphilium sp.]HQU22880.1 HAD-IA family hydrolase [Acidiphilium sp.]